MSPPSTCRLAAAALAACLAAWPATGPAAPPPGAPPAKIDLAAEAKALAARWSERLGQGYTTRIDSRRHIVYVSAIDQKAFRHVTALLGTVHDALAKRLFPRPLQRNVTVILPTVKDFRRLVTNTKAHGVYDIANRKLVSISFSNVLIHEFIHALHHNDQDAANQRHPTWIVEGLAMLFQASQAKAGKFEIADSGAPAQLQAALKANKAHSLADLSRMTQKAFMADAELCYRQAHQVMLYLHEQGKLDAFYAAYRSGYARDTTGTEALSAVFGKPPAQVEADWRKWVLARKPAWQPRRQRLAHLGIRMAKSTDGVEVTGLVRGSSAHRAGLLKKGDVITSLARRQVRVARDLIVAVQSCRPGQIVDIEIIRNGRPLILKHRLGLAPK